MAGSERRIVQPLKLDKPAAGQPLKVRITSPAPWKITLAKCRLVTSAVVGARTIFVALLDADQGVVSRFTQGATIPENSSVSCTWAIGYNILNTVSLGNFGAPLPDIDYLQGMQFWFNLLGFDAGDQLDNGFLLVEQYLESEPELPTGPEYESDLTHFGGWEHEPESGTLMP